MGIDGARVDHAFVTPDFVEQPVAFLDSALAAHQHVKQFEFDARQAQWFARHFDVVSRRIERDRSDRQLFFVGGFAFPAAQNGADAQDELARAERLCHVIVRAEFQADDAIDLLRFRGQHQDWDMSRGPIGLENLADFQARHFRQHQIENDERRRFLLRETQPSRSVRRRV
jgi:hypothetical protein